MKTRKETKTIMFLKSQSIDLSAPDAYDNNHKPSLVVSPFAIFS